MTPVGPPFAAMTMTERCSTQAEPSHITFNRKVVMARFYRAATVFLALPVLAVGFVSPLYSRAATGFGGKPSLQWGIQPIRIESALSAAHIIIAGAPASGKGTQCEVIKEEFGVVHLSTGDMLRAAVSEGTEVGKQAKDFMDSGKLVPDDVIIGVVRR